MECTALIFLWQNLLKCDPLRVYSGNTVRVAFPKNQLKKRSRSVVEWCGSSGQRLANRHVVGSSSAAAVLGVRGKAYSCELESLVRIMNRRDQSFGITSIKSRTIPVPPVWLIFSATPRSPTMYLQMVNVCWSSVTAQAPRGQHKGPHTAQNRRLCSASPPAQTETDAPVLVLLQLLRFAVGKRLTLRPVYLDRNFQSPNHRFIHD